MLCMEADKSRAKVIGNNKAGSGTLRTDNCIRCPLCETIVLFFKIFSGSRQNGSVTLEYRLARYVVLTNRTSVVTRNLTV